MNENDWLCRTELLLGKEKLSKLKNAHVLIAGLGGVGGYVVENLCRAGINKFTLVDNDKVNISNLNRQIIASKRTIGQPKVDLIKSRLLEINPHVDIQIINKFITEENISEIVDQDFNCIADAIDTLTPKVGLLAEAVRQHIPVVSSMGSGGRTDPSKVFVDDISKSHHCKFAYIVRKYLHRQNIYEGIRVVFSVEEVPKTAIITTDGSDNKRSIVGTISYMPAVFGCYCASEVVKKILFSV